MRVIKDRSAFDGSLCPVCDGTIIIETYQVSDSGPLKKIGGKPQYSTETVIFCNDCGVSFHKLPQRGRRGTT